MTYAQTEESNAREQTRQQLAAFLWRREGGHCVSYLVSTLAQAQSSNDALGSNNMQLGDLVEQAFELTSPVPDYEEPVRDHIYDLERHEITEIYDERSVEYDGSDVTKTLASKLVDEIMADDAEEFCHANRLDPYDREVYEHWIVSNWLANKLTAKGEKCDKDFAGLVVWARCTTGQSIACDGVMQEIACDLWPTAEDRKHILA